jgi:hypothetical protein
MAGRTRRQCRERWIHYLLPKVSTSPWTHDEDARLQAAVERDGPRWKCLEAFFPGRKENHLKNRYILLTRQKHRGHAPSRPVPAVRLPVAPVEPLRTTDADPDAPLLCDSETWGECDDELSLF